MRTRSSRVAAGVAVAAFAAGCVQRPALRGPLPVRNQHPAQLLVMHLDPAGAGVLEAGQTALRTDLAHTSLFLFGASPQGSWEMDGELLRAAVDAKVGLGGGLQLGLQVPFAHTSGGFLDSLIIDYHDLFGLPDQDRSTNPRDRFAVEAGRGGQTVWSMERSSAELMDVPVHLAWQVLPPGERQLGLALRAGAELPTGDPRAGYGNGQVDVALGAVAEYRVAGIGCTAQLQHTFAGSPARSRAVGFRFSDVTSAGLGLELPIRQDLSVLLQAEWETSTLRDVGARLASRDQALLWVGGRWTPSPRWSLEVGLAEDLVPKASPDVSFWVAMEWRLGGAGGAP